MQRAKTFFYVSLGILALAVAFQMGAQTAQGQFGTIAGASFSDPWGMVVLDNGDVYMAQLTSSLPTMNNWTFTENVFGAPVPAIQTTWGKIKADRR